MQLLIASLVQKESHRWHKSQKWFHEINRNQTKWDCLWIDRFVCLFSSGTTNIWTTLIMKKMLLHSMWNILREEWCPAHLLTGDWPVGEDIEADGVRVGRSDPPTITGPTLLAISRGKMFASLKSGHNWIAVRFHSLIKALLRVDLFTEWGCFGNDRNDNSSLWFSTSRESSGWCDVLTQMFRDTGGCRRVFAPTTFGRGAPVYTLTQNEYGILDIFEIFKSRRKKPSI